MTYHATGLNSTRILTTALRDVTLFIRPDQLASPNTTDFYDNTKVAINGHDLPIMADFDLWFMTFTINGGGDPTYPGGKINAWRWDGALLPSGWTPSQAVPSPSPAQQTILMLGPDETKGVPNAGGSRVLQYPPQCAYPKPIRFSVTNHDMLVFTIGPSTAGGAKYLDPSGYLCAWMYWTYAP